MGVPLGSTKVGNKLGKENSELREMLPSGPWSFCAFAPAGATYLCALFLYTSLESGLKQILYA